MLNLYTLLAANIRKQRLQLGLSQEKLGEVLHVSHQIISKWENAVTSPDIQSLYNLAQLFGITLDELCGTPTEKICKEYPLDLKANYTALYSGWQSFSEELSQYPTNEALYTHALRYLRLMHDRVESEEQKIYVNHEIYRIANTLLDMATTIHNCSLAHYNLALYHDEQVNRMRGNEEDKSNAARAKYHGEHVLYSDMPGSLYCSLGTHTIREDREKRQQFLLQSIETAQRAGRNLLSSYRQAKELGTNDQIIELEYVVEQLCTLENKLKSILPD